MCEAIGNVAQRIIAIAKSECDNTEESLKACQERKSDLSEYGDNIFTQFIQVKATQKITECQPQGGGK